MHVLPPSVPGDALLLDNVPKDCPVQTSWDVSSSFPRLLSPHIPSCPLCISLTTLPLLSSSRDPVSIQHGSILLLSLAFPLETPQDAGAHKAKEEYCWGLLAARRLDTPHRAEVNASGVQRGHGLKLSVTEGEDKQCPGRICWLRGHVFVGT